MNFNPSWSLLFHYIFPSILHYCTPLFPPDGCSVWCSLSDDCQMPVRCPTRQILPDICLGGKQQASDNRLTGSTTQTETIWRKQWCRLRTFSWPFSQQGIFVNIAKLCSPNNFLFYSSVSYII